MSLSANIDMMEELSLSDDSFVSNFDTSIDNFSFDQGTDSFNESLSFDEDELAHDFLEKVLITETEDHQSVVGDQTNAGLSTDSSDADMEIVEPAEPSEVEMSSDLFTNAHQDYELEPDFQYFLDHGYNRPPPGNPTATPSVCAETRRQIADDMIKARETQDMRREMLLLDRLSNLSIDDQIAITSVADPQLCSDLLRQHGCNELFNHKGYSFFDHYSVVNGMDTIVPTVGMSVRFGSATNGRGDPVMLAEHFQVSWDSSVDDQVFAIGLIQTFDFEGYDLMMLYRRNHYITGVVDTVFSPKKDGKITFVVHWEASPAGCTRN
ncbi:hypothetical protein BJ508DRAFT_321457 [Ascobolus immersus RN42]|uniref:Uncharacterized protein n=1 Tax=Ascobolus immersus RN42 TaxID=1160509 RepID=A0A3N4IQ73_ASCIM|nr:hypothetical protein BJ508DRAFT_321457 [Ascobolus immersus RN42]